MEIATVKFLVVQRGGQSEIVFGSSWHRYHHDIAEEGSIPKSAIHGGGLADLAERRIFGTSYGYGPYDAEVVRNLLPNWQVEESSIYW